MPEAYSGMELGAGTKVPPSSRFDRAEGLGGFLVSPTVCSQQKSDVAMLFCFGGRRVAKISNVRFGSLADILTSPRHVRFTPNNGRWAAHPSQHLKRPKGHELECRQACPSQQEALLPARSACMGGHGTEPYVQNTQQSPGSGFSVSPQFGQS